MAKVTVQRQSSDGPDKIYGGKNVHFPSDDLMAVIEEEEPVSYDDATVLRYYNWDSVEWFEID